MVSQSVHQAGSQLVTVLYDKCLDSAFSSGQMDEATHEMMTKPRCGLKDRRDSEGVYSRSNRFTKLGELHRIFVVTIIIIIIIIINCNWVVTRWQWLFYMYTNTIHMKKK